MRLFQRGKSARTSANSQKADLERLRQWVSSRHGVEVYVEPATSTSPMTLLLVASDGESTRIAIESAADASKFARKNNLPIYDTNRVGIPQRKRDYDVAQMRARTQSQARTRARSSARSTSQGSAGSQGSTGSGDPAASPRKRDRSVAEAAAVKVLCELAGQPDAGIDVSNEELARLVRKARARNHPDRTGGDRTNWDRLENVIRTLGVN